MDLAQVVTTAQKAWPQLQLDADKLGRFIAERVATADLGSAPAADLALVHACVDQHAAAHVAFDVVLGEVDAAGAATRSPQDLVDEVKQILRVQLLVPRDGKPPAIAGYRGKGPLRGWIRITATRELIRHQKQQRRELTLHQVLADDGLGAGSAGTGADGRRGGLEGVDPLLSQLKAEYRSEFSTALGDAIAKLSAEDRTLLRQQIVEGFSIDEVGAAFGVHRATAARWLSRARSALVSATHEVLAARLNVPIGEIEAVIRLVQSRLDTSVVRMLRDGER